jgi:hypothetical protein
MHRICPKGILLCVAAFLGAFDVMRDPERGLSVVMDCQPAGHGKDVLWMQLLVLGQVSCVIQSNVCGSIEQPAAHQTTN